MKNLSIVLGLSLILTKGVSQINKIDSTLNLIYSQVAHPSLNNYIVTSNDTYLRGNFTKVFKNLKIWEDFVKGPDKKYLWIEAPETNWYDREKGPLKSNKFNLCPDPVMVDSTVVNYYNTKIKDFKYDRFTYEIEYQDDGTIREFYEFFIGENKIRTYSLGWRKNQLLNISDYHFYGRL